MRVLIAILVMVMVSPVMALECPDDSLNVFHSEGTSYAFTYDCTLDDGTSVRTYVFSGNQETSREKIVEILLRGKCVTFRDMTICRSSSVAETTP